MKFNRKQVKHLLNLVRMGLTSLQACNSGAGGTELWNAVQLLEHELTWDRAKPPKERVGTTSCQHPPRFALGPTGKVGLEYSNDGSSYNTWVVLAHITGYEVIRNYLISEQPSLLEAAQNTIKTQAQRITELESQPRKQLRLQCTNISDCEVLVGDMALQPKQFFLIEL